MMTCLVFPLEQTRHMDFIDGADAGYALGALRLEAQLEASASVQTGKAALTPAAG